MTRIWTALILTLTLGLSAYPALAAFENLTVSPRARAMGDAGVTVGDDAYAPYLNPACLGVIGQSTVATSYTRPYALSFTDLFYAGGAFPLSDKAGALGFGLRHFGVSYEDTKLQSEWTLTLAHGLKIYQDMHATATFGYALNFYRLEFGNTVGFADDGSDGVDPGHGGALGVDGSLFITLHERTRLGVLAKNLNNPQIGKDNEELQRRINFGVAYEPYIGVITTFEIESQLDKGLMYHGGVEMEVARAFRLRFGIQANPSKLMAGFGYAWKILSLDYGFSTGGGALDSTHQFGLSFFWGGEAQ